MQIQVGKLKETLGLFKSVVQKTPSVKSLRCVRMGGGVMRATDLEVGVEVECPEAVEKVLLPYHLAVQWLRYVPGDEMLTITGKESGGVDLAWAGGQTSYPTEKVEDYPPAAEVKPRLEADIDGDALVRAMLSVAGYAAADKSRPVLTGVCLILGDPVGVAASDGFRMAWRDVARVAIPPAEEVKEVIIPSGTVRVLAELMAGTPRTTVAVGSGNFGAMMVSGRRMRLALGETHFRAQFGPVSFTGRLIKGAFPNYKALVPAEPPTQVRVFAPDMERAVKGLAAVARDSSGIVRLVWKTGGMSLSGGGEGVGKTSSLIPAEVVKGEPDRVAIGIDKLLGYLKGKQGMVTMCVTGRSSPVLFRSALPPEVLLMPMGVRWEDEEQKPVEKPATESTGAAQGVEQAQAVQPEQQAEDTAEPRSEAAAGAEQVAGQSPKPAKESAKRKRVVRVKGSKKQGHVEKPQRSMGNKAKGASQE